MCKREQTGHRSGEKNRAGPCASGVSDAPSPKAASGLSTERALLDVVELTLRDLQPEAPIALRVALDSSLDRDLALDSLARMELLLRIERRFGVDLPEDTLQEAETVRDLLGAVERATAEPTARGGPPDEARRGRQLIHVRARSPEGGGDSLRAGGRCSAMRSAFSTRPATRSVSASRAASNSRGRRRHRATFATPPRPRAWSTMVGWTLATARMRLPATSTSPAA